MSFLFSNIASKMPNPRSTGSSQVKVGAEASSKAINNQVCNVKLSVFHFCTQGQLCRVAYGALCVWHLSPPDPGAQGPPTCPGMHCIVLCCGNLAAGARLNASQGWETYSPWRPPLSPASLGFCPMTTESI